ncbi:hypothetical protein ACTMTI_12000 [Nonomuraea sp. H19]|uniref:hypothetical protein n=1 Tax=Nonomuraea sp. H19 TaxID=3452206 RepID=UPI003F8A07BE
MNIADLARVRDEDLVKEPVGQASGAGARALMESIMSEEREPARRRFKVRRGLGLAVLATGLAVALVLGLPLGGPVTQFANAAVSVEAGDNYLNVTITDPEADVAMFTEAFRAVGLNAEVKKVPVAPEDVGALIGPATPGDFPPGTGVTRSSRQESCASARCTKISMPIHYTGRVIFGIGRPAAPGERYAESVQIHPVNGGDYDPRGKTVAEVRAEMEKRGLKKIEYVAMWSHPDGTGSGYDVDAVHIKDDWIVGAAMKTASDAVQVTVELGPDVPRDSLPKSSAPQPRLWWED